MSQPESARSAIERILGAIEDAAKCYHNTQQWHEGMWGDETRSCWEYIRSEIESALSQSGEITPARGLSSTLKMSEIARACAPSSTAPSVGARRWRIYETGDGVDCRVHPEGAYVLHTDYEALRQRFEKACGEITRLSGTESAIEPKYIVRCGGECPQDWLCADIPEVQKALCEALYGNPDNADADEIGKFLSEVQLMGDEREVHWTFEDGWLTVIRRTDRTTERR